MSQPLVTFKSKEKVGNIVDILKSEYFCGFPVVDDDPAVSIN